MYHNTIVSFVFIFQWGAAVLKMLYRLYVSKALWTSSYIIFFVCFLVLVLLFQCAVFINELMHTVKQFIHERQYLKSRYENSYQILFANAMVSYKKLLLFITCFVCSYYLYQHTLISQSYNFFCMFIALKLAFDVQKVLSMVWKTEQSIKLIIKLKMEFYRNVQRLMTLYLSNH